MEQSIRAIENEFLTITDVKARFEAIDPKGQERKYCSAGEFEYKEPSHYHIQGVQRLSGKDWFVFSSSDSDWAKLAIVDDSQQSVVKVEKLDEVHEHAGGIDTCGDILVVPCESDQDSVIYFLDTENPPVLGTIRDPLECSGKKSSAAGITQFNMGPCAGDYGGHYLLAVACHGDKEIRFYVYGTDIRDEFLWQTVVQCRDKLDDQYENINLITQADGQVFMVGTHSTGQVWNRDWADLFTVNVQDRSVTVNYVTHKHLYCPGSSTFEGGAGIYVDGERDVLEMYAVRRWTHNGTKTPEIKMTAFPSLA